MNSKITKPGTRVGLKHYVIISYAHEVGYHIIKGSFLYLPVLYSRKHPVPNVHFT